MNSYPQTLAPEPYFSGMMQFIHFLACNLRNHASDFSAEQLSDLGDALHNIPESLVRYGINLDEQKIRDWYLSSYDDKWASSPPHLNLNKMLDGCIENARRDRDKM
ncbi:MAG: hypothetical protein AAF333_07045 [Planctomycetota bacterium]